MSRFDQAIEEVKAAAREWARKDTDRQLSLARALTGQYAECRHLEKDYVEEREGDWTR